MFPLHNRPHPTLAANIALDRKSLAELAVNHPYAVAKIAAQAAAAAPAAKPAKSPASATA